VFAEQIKQTSSPIPTCQDAIIRLNDAKNDILDVNKFPQILLSIGVSGKLYDEAARRRYIENAISAISDAEEEVTF
jgi:hypothetical protein